MLTARELASGLYGAWRLAHLDPGGMAWFDISARGAWRSFRAAGVVAPLFLLLVVVRWAADDGGPGLARTVALESCFYVIAWFAFPAAMIHVSRLLDRSPRFPAFVTAYNWAAVIQNAVYLPLAILATTGAMPPEMAAVVDLAALSAILFYAWFVARVSLLLPPFTAFGVVMLDLVLGLVINVIAERVLAG